EELVVI
ncbi:magnesium and cobalt transport protein CorA, partial [Escherichia coli 5905]